MTSMCMRGQPNYLLRFITVFVSQVGKRLLFQRKLLDMTCLIIVIVHTKSESFSF